MPSQRFVYFSVCDCCLSNYSLSAMNLIINLGTRPFYRILTRGYISWYVLTLQPEGQTRAFLTLSGRENLLKILRVDGGWVWPVQSQEWEVKFFVPQATNSIWRRETRSPPPIDRPETISFQVRRIGIDQKRSV